MANAALKKRGSLLIWLDKEMTWLAAHCPAGGCAAERGRSRFCSSSPCGKRPAWWPVCCGCRTLTGRCPTIRPYAAGRRLWLSRSPIAVRMGRSTCSSPLGGTAACQAMDGAYDNESDVAGLEFLPGSEKFSRRLEKHIRFFHSDLLNIAKCAERAEIWISRQLSTQG